MIALFLICGGLFIAALSAVTYALVTNAFNEGYKKGVQRGTYAACRQQVDTESFFRCVDSTASKTSFPHRE